MLQTIEWYDSAQTAIERLARLGCDALAVLDGDQAIGRVSRDDLDALVGRGNWPGAVLVRDVMRRTSSG